MELGSAKYRREREAVVVYRATNIETGEVIEGGVRDLARTLGVVPKYLYNAVANQQKIRYVWFITSERKTKPKCISTHLPSDVWDEWDRVTEPFKKLSEARRVKKYAN
jgi:hypothetical protein